MKTVVAAVSAASLLCLAFPAAAAPREKVDLAISSAGYDLTDPAQTARLHKQIDLAIIEACNPSDRLSKGPQPDLKCRAELRRDAAVKVAALANAQRQRMAGL